MGVIASLPTATGAPGSCRTRGKERTSRRRSDAPPSSSAEKFEVVGAFDKRPSPGGFNVNVDNFAIIPNSTYQRVYGVRVARIGRLGTILNIQISVVPRDGVQTEARQYFQVRPNGRKDRSAFAIRQ
jgi:hypothetical protein